jgi:hypothetical protein
VEPNHEETAEIIERSLHALEIELRCLPDKQAYDQADAINPSYVRDRKFRLMFLRSEYFDAKKAAAKLVLYLNEKVALFGPATLARPVYLSDLDKDDLAVLKSGVYQLLPARDSTGRAIITDFHLIVKRCYKHPENLVRH